MEQETILTPEQVIEAMRQAVNEVPSYVEVQAMKAWLENNQDEEAPDAA